MITTLQGLLDAGMNAFALRLLAKEFGKMKAPPGEPVHVEVMLGSGRTLWVTFSLTPPAELAEPQQRG